LPLDAPRTAISFSTGKLGRAVALVSDLAAAQGNRTGAETDLVVLVDPRVGALRTAYDALRPGGACYCEWYSPFAGGLHGVRRKLQTAGFTDIAFYWAWPWPTRRAPLFWVPLDAPQALRHLMGMTPGSKPRHRRPLRSILYSLWRVGLRLGIAIPLCTTARKSGDAGAHGRGLLDRIQTGWSPWGLGPQPAHLSCALYTPGTRSINKVIALVFGNSTAEPAMIVKLARVPEAGRALEREAANLRALHASGRGTRAPRPLFLDGEGGSVSLGETVLSGQPLWTLLDERSYRRLALTVTDWLTGLASPESLAPRDAWWERLVEPVLTEFEQSFGSVSNPDDVASTRRALTELGELPLAFEHRDCSPWNVLVADDGRIALPDWESAEPEGLPGLDLIYFLSYLAFFQDGAMQSGDFRTSYRGTLDPTTFAGRVTAECEERYAQGIGVGREALTPLRLLVWLLHSHSEYDQFVAEHGEEPQRSRLESSIFVTLWQEELRFRARCL
jgi:Phosphotransferase enzyme family